MTLRFGYGLEEIELGEIVGRGGSGEVFAARHRETGTRLAAKIYPFDRMDPAFRPRERFQRECRILSRMEHPAFPALYGCGEEEDGSTGWALMEWIEGEPLSAYRSRSSQRGHPPRLRHRFGPRCLARSGNPPPRHRVRQRSRRDAALRPQPAADRSRRREGHFVERGPDYGGSFSGPRPFRLARAPDGRRRRRTRRSAERRLFVRRPPVRVAVRSAAVPGRDAGPRDEGAEEKGGAETGAQGERGRGGRRPVGVRGEPPRDRDREEAVFRRRRPAAG